MMYAIIVFITESVLLHLIEKGWWQGNLNVLGTHRLLTTVRRFRYSSHTNVAAMHTSTNISMPRPTYNIHYV